MRELIEGVTKIRWKGKENPDVRYSLWEHKEGTYIGNIEGTLRWKSPEGVDFVYCDKVNLWYDGDFEFVDEDESPKLKVGDMVGIKSLTYIGVVEDIDEVEYSISVRWEDGTLGCYDEDVLVKREVPKPQEDSPASQHISKLGEDVEVTHQTLGSKVKSTGSSSDYYKIVLPDWLLLKQKDNGFIMLEDLAEIMFDNDFNYVNVMKAQKRMFDLEGGRGKEGNTFEYDATKCKYYIDKQVEVFNREQEDK